MNRFKIVLVIVLGLVLNSCYGDAENVLLSDQALPDGFKICYMGDAGSGKAAQYRVAKALEKEGCDQVRYTGDVIYNHGLKSADDKDFQNKFYKPYKNLLEEQDVPFFMVMGNHDHHRSVDPWYEIAEKYKNIIFPHAYYAEAYKDICFLNLDTNFKRSEQKKWLKQFFSQEAFVNTCRLKFAMGHHPYRSVGRHGNAKFFIKSFLKKSLMGNVDAYFAGHDHNLSYDGTYKGTHLFVSGAGGKLRDLKKEPKEGNYAISQYGYISLTILREGTSLAAQYDFRVLADGAEDFETTFTGVIAAQ
ncbi:MAG: hypothetical protein HOO06_15210 [Bdellovibrionaceae bacterium]|jgi:tartrate-resistant acid phosphatase type 5|nr:hypothetical protein [Pseudobdellovibrionaceae bacterium]